jgi:hypothetical protein
MEIENARKADKSILFQIVLGASGAYVIMKAKFAIYQAPLL